MDVSAIRKEVFANTPASEANTCGRAGEHLVCSDILSRGHECFIAEGRLPYDVVADIGGRMVRIQVKTTAGIKPCPQRKNHTPVYMWNARKFGKGSRYSYTTDDTDLVAYVALDRAHGDKPCARRKDRRVGLGKLGIRVLEHLGRLVQHKRELEG